MANLFAVPDKERNYQGYMVYVLAIVWCVISGIIVSTGLYLFPHIWLRWVTFICISLFISVFNLTLIRFGYVRLASHTLVVMLWLYATIPCYSAGGIMAPGILSQMGVILTAGLLLNWRGGLAVGLLSLGADFWMAYIEVTGHLPAPTVIHTPITRWITGIIPFGALIALQYYATSHLRTGLLALQREIGKREEAETIKDQTLYELGERVKELKTLYSVSRILQDVDTSPEKQFREIAALIPQGWQYPEITSACISIGATTYPTHNYKPSAYTQQAEMQTIKGTNVRIEVVYSKAMPELAEGPFLKEERDLITLLVEMLKIHVERRERGTELKDYKYALDIAAIVSISGPDATFNFVNENFCRTSKYSSEELLGKHHSIIWSEIHSTEFFAELGTAIQGGETYRREFCRKAKDGALYWTDTTIVPFLDENGTIYQYLSISHDITERKEAGEKIKQSERLLKKITSQVPGNTYMFEIDESGNIHVLFMSRGTDASKHTSQSGEISERPEKLEELLLDEDKVKFIDAMKEGYRTESGISIQYRILVDGAIRWRWMQAVPEKDDSGKMLWYGATSDITPLVDYISSIEQIIFDIGHVIRRPIASMSGMTKLIFDGKLSDQEIRQFSQTLYDISQEMDKFISELNLAYNEKRKDTNHNIDISYLIDRRDSLFR